MKAGCINDRIKMYFLKPPQQSRQVYPPSQRHTEVRSQALRAPSIDYRLYYVLAQLRSLDFIRVYIHVRCTLDCMQSTGLRRSNMYSWFPSAYMQTKTINSCTFKQLNLGNFQVLVPGTAVPGRSTRYYLHVLESILKVTQQR